MTNIVNQVPYLRDQRQFPTEPEELAKQIDRTYVDVALAVNNRTIGLYPTNKSAVTGNKWYLANDPNQSLRKLFTFTSTTSITHGISVSQAVGIVQSYGMYTNGTNWFGLISGSPTAITGQISFYITPTQIIFTVDAAAPTLTTGYIVIEWLSNQ